MKKDTDIQRPLNRMSREHIEKLVDDLVQKNISISNQNIELRDKLSRIERISKIR